MPAPESAVFLRRSLGTLRAYRAHVLCTRSLVSRFSFRVVNNTAAETIGEWGGYESGLTDFNAHCSQYELLTDEGQQ